MFTYAEPEAEPEAEAEALAEAYPEADALAEAFPNAFAEAKRSSGCRTVIRKMAKTRSCPCKVNNLYFLISGFELYHFVLFFSRNLRNVARNAARNPRNARNAANVSANVTDAAVIQCIQVTVWEWAVVAQVAVVHQVVQVVQVS